MSLPTKKVILPLEALKWWTDYNTSIGKPPPAKQYVYRLLKRYEGRLSYKDSENKWKVYEDVWKQYVEYGFPNLDIRKPNMDLPTALIYCHRFGLSSKYTLRELRRTLNERYVVVKSKDPKIRDTVSRTQLNKFLYDENTGG